MTEDSQTAGGGHSTMGRTLGGTNRTLQDGEQKGNADAALNGDAGFRESEI